MRRTYTVLFPIKIPPIPPSITRSPSYGSSTTVARPALCTTSSSMRVFRTRSSGSSPNIPRSPETSQHQHARRDGRKQKKLKIVMFDSQESTVNRSQGLRKEKEGTFKNLGLFAAQYNGIAACAYSLKILTVIHSFTLLYMVCSIKTSFYLLF